MKKSSISYLRCVNCNSGLELKVYEESFEIIEGLLRCLSCGSKYPIISGVPILWSDLSTYLSNRAQLGGELLVRTKNNFLKSFLKDSLRSVSPNNSDASQIERRWVTTYKNSLKSKFYTQVRETLGKIPKFSTVLEHGCSIGHMSKYMAQRHDTVFGIDQSYYAILEAINSSQENLDFFVANSLKPPFGNKKFGLVIALNMLELIEPFDLLKMISSQCDGMLVISDPYDFERGRDSVRNRVDASSLRAELERLGFKVTDNTRKPGFLPWKLNVNPRLSLHYKADLVVARNQNSSRHLNL